MNKLLLLASITILLSVFQSCQKEDQSLEIESYHGEELSIEKIEKFLTQQMDSLNIPSISISIINEGEIAYNNTIGVKSLKTKQLVDENSIFEAASLSKPLFAFLVMRLSEKGIIDLDRPLHYYLPDPKMEIDQRYKEVSARMVLSHKTGFPNWRWFMDPPENKGLSRGDFFMLHDPDTDFSYSGEAYQYLAKVIAHLNFLNMYELNQLFQDEVAIPFGMEHSYFVWNDFLRDNMVFGHKNGKARKMEWGTALPNQNSKVFNAAGGLRTEANSYAHFITSIMKEEGLFPETYKQMLDPKTEIPKESTNFKEDGITHWSLGFGIKPMENDTIYRHGGSNSDYQSEFAFSIKRKYGYVFFVNCDKGNEFNKNLEVFLDMQR